MIKAGAAFSVRFINNGDQITVVRNILKYNSNEGASLFQVIDTTSGVIAPDWTVPANQPVICMKLRSSRDYPVQITQMRWAYDGNNMEFVYDGSNWVYPTNQNERRFMACIDGGYYKLRICGNLADPSEISNKLISYGIDYVSNAVSDTVSGDIPVIIQEAGSDSHIIQITTDRVELDDQNPVAHMSVSAQYGVEPITIGQNGYTIKWFIGPVEQSTTTSTFNVTRDMIEGGDIIIAKLLKNGTVVAQDSQRINDIADEYQILHSPYGTGAGSYVVTRTTSARYELILTRNKVPVTSNVDYAWQNYNSLGIEKSSGTGSIVTILPADCLCETQSGSYYNDADVRVTAEFDDSL